MKKKKKVNKRVFKISWYNIVPTILNILTHILFILGFTHFQRVLYESPLRRHSWNKLKVILKVSHFCLPIIQHCFRFTFSFKLSVVITHVKLFDKKYIKKEFYVRNNSRLGTDGPTKMDEFLEKFQWGDHFQSKKLCCRFLPL